jgi:four helix bundle protein
MENDIKSYRDLIVWQKSMKLVIEVYHLTDTFPKSELYGIVSQIRRSAVSVPSNIAEGKQRGTRKEYRQFLIVAFGSAAELDTQLEISRELRFCSVQDCIKIHGLLEEVSRMLNTLIKKLGKPRA